MDEQRIIYSQPYETKVKVIDTVTAKGDLQPEIEVIISRKLENSIEVENIITSDINLAVKKARDALTALRSLM